jgi:hypothetical protein
MLGQQEVSFLKIPALSIHAASRDVDNVPSVARSLACRLSPDLRRVTLLFSVPETDELLAHIGDTHVIAAVFSLPSTHETLQLKGTDARVEETLPGDPQLVDSHREALVDHVEKLGFSRAAVETMLSCDTTDLIAITFTPCLAFSQTPGPNAGQAVGAT